MTSQSMTHQENPIYKKLSGIGFHRGTIFAFIILTALLAFEAFNYSTTNYALADLLGDLKFAGLGWASILSIAFCGIDFAGIARLFTPDSRSKEMSESWYLFGAWILAATMNAMLTWWAVSLALENHTLKSTSMIGPDTLIHVVPIFVAIMVWLIRILIIGSLSMASDRLFSPSGQVHSSGNPDAIRSYSARPTPFRTTTASPVSSNSATASFQPSHKPAMQFATPSPHQPVSSRIEESTQNAYEGDHSTIGSGTIRPDPVYQPLSSSAHPSGSTHIM